MLTAGEFNKAIQRKGALHDSLGVLRNGKIRTNAMGIPHAISGSFAVVYQTSLHNDKWALRCFMMPAADQQLRYEAIRAHLKAHPSPFFVDFRYHSEGLHVNGTWEPLMSMEWRNGVNLAEYVESLLADPPALLQLASDWIAMFEQMRAAEIAHGDIHHDNVIVCDGKLVLVDYDAMYVPALKGLKLEEGGLPHYQHPARPRGDFGSYMDHFPSWIVFYSLLMLSIAPGLWADFDGGDQTLLFRREDYEQPKASRLFERLRTSRNPVLELIALDVESFLKGDPKKVRPLSFDAVKAAALPVELPKPHTWWVAPQERSDWWRKRVYTQETKTPSWPPKRES
ncbi:hypothetical protein [Deinococcus marmoris]|uniref:hypothetical protein n=1 Tax=Deinococcus marmoris TaxID=249408 RepID=UPI0004966DBA|nr:hypothetical protein [Deinococcus marmoris]